MDKFLLVNPEKLNIQTIAKGWDFPGEKHSFPGELFFFSSNFIFEGFILRRTLHQENCVKAFYILNCII